MYDIIYIKVKHRWTTPLLRMIGPNTAAGEAVVLLFDTLRQLKLRQMMQEPPNVVFLKLGSPGIPNQDFGAMDFYATV